MLNLVLTEFCKLRRRKSILLMPAAVVIMPFFALFYFISTGKEAVDAIQFYKWTAFGYTPWIILPVELGILCTMLMYDEKRYDTLKQLWIVPVGRLEFFFSKFVIVLMYAVGFMLLVAVTSVAFSAGLPLIVFRWESVWYLLRKCVEIGVLAAFAVLPLLAVAASAKGYILPVCVTIVFAFLGFIMLMVNMYLHPLSCMTAIVNRDMPGVSMPQEPNLLLGLLGIAVWDAGSVWAAYLALGRNK